LWYDCHSENLLPWSLIFYNNIVPLGWGFSFVRVHFPTKFNISGSWGAITRTPVFLMLKTSYLRGKAGENDFSLACYPLILLGLRYSAIASK
jgi:hypothetical protein